MDRAVRRWLSPHLEDHEKLLAKYPEFDWMIFCPRSRDGELQGEGTRIPYRVTASILNYQKQVLAMPASTKRRRTGTNSDRVQSHDDAAERYGLGIWGARDRPSWVAFRVPACNAEIISTQKHGNPDQQ